jgi:hypothetical protein
MMGACMRKRMHRTEKSEAWFQSQVSAALLAAGIGG